MEVFVPAYGVPERMAERIPNPNARDGSVRPKLRRALKDCQPYPQPKVRDGKRNLSLKGFKVFFLTQGVP